MLLDLIKNARLRGVNCAHNNFIDLTLGDVSRSNVLNIFSIFFKLFIRHLILSEKIRVRLVEFVGALAFTFTRSTCTFLLRGLRVALNNAL